MDRQKCVTQEQTVLNREDFHNLPQYIYVGYRPRVSIFCISIAHDGIRSKHVVHLV